MRRRRSVFLIFAVTLADDVSGTLLGLEVDLADILADNADTHHLHAGKEADDTRCTCPALRGVAHEVGDQSVDQKYEAYKSNEESEPCDDLDGLYGKARNSVESKRKQLRDGVMTFARETLVSVVINAGALEAYHREQTS